MLIQPVPIIIDTSFEKLTGFVMRITTIGLQVEMDKVPFKAGAIVTCQFSLDDGATTIIEKVRSIKHFDGFLRKPPKKKKVIRLDQPEQPAAPEEKPKKLIEFHFQKILESTRVSITKHAIAERERAALRAKKS